MNPYERPNIRRMQGYQPGEQPSDSETIKLNTNENPYPPSPAVDRALLDFAPEQLRTYPEPLANDLRTAIAKHHSIDVDNVVVTHAGDEALRLAATTFVDTGGSFVSTDPTYSLYPVLAQIQDAQMHTQPLTEDWSLPEDFAAHARSAGAQLTCIVNPHAPSGTLIDYQRLAEIASQISGVLLIGEAYVDFAGNLAAKAGPRLLRDHGNVLLLRTFSKGYSLAGLRLGYLLGHADLIRPILEKTRDSYNVDAISQALGLAALQDQDYARKTWAAVGRQRDQLALSLEQRGLYSPPSATNFLLATIPPQLSAQSLYQGLKKAGILVRYFDTPRLQDKLRISIGTEEQQQRLLTELDRLIQAG